MNRLNKDVITLMQEIVKLAAAVAALILLFLKP